ncbi:dynactin subunit 1-like isoform X2 [Mizuhopecten yessoensis]|uniref:dynactin subunit 1-like isoform X2 n=1 Tax=Mizuhopecten yessoensis TaxID=6573 RepID=UPI000B4578D9|nr:dynactin subunit 1-like isoform X2 [Mizuhopecten yessoensis]
MADGKQLKIGTRVEVIGKGVIGAVAYIGTTLFSSGKWIGVILDDAKGKNNGVVQGKTYFTCDDNHGIFVRQSQIVALDSKEPSPVAAPEPATPVPATPKPASGIPGPRTVKRSGLRPPSYVGKSSENLVDMSATPKRAPSVPSDLSKIAATPLQTPAKESSIPSGLSRISRGASKESTPPPIVPTELKELKAPPKEVTPTSKPPSTKTTPTTPADVSSLEVKMTNLQQSQEIEGLNAEIKDLNEKLETLKIKRAEDKGKLKDFERAKLQMQQLQEYKSKIQETNKELQQQLANAKREARDIQDAFDQYKDEMSDLAESMELATLDKEMAEEKSETLQQEVDNLKERNEEVTLDLEILRGEISEKGTDGLASSYQVKQLEQQNERLKDALVKMRDLSTSDKQDAVKNQKLSEKLTNDIAVLKRDKEKLQNEVTEQQTQVIELKEQVDAALGAEEMVESLAEKNLQLEGLINELEEEKADLEALHEMNEELQENTRESELELREELDLANGRATEMQRKLDATQETIADYDATISKFRELVSSLQDTIRDMRSRQVESEQKTETPTMEAFDFKTKFAESKAYAKEVGSVTIDMELRKLEVQQASYQVTLLKSFMPNSFSNRGGDQDAVGVLLMIPRVISKCELLASQVKDKFEMVENINRETVLKSHMAQQCSYALQMVLMLNTLTTIMKQYEYAMRTCSVELFLKIGTLLPEMNAHEKSVDYFIELLRKDQLDENISLDLLEKSINYFQQLHAVHLVAEKVDCTSLMANKTKLVLSACDCVSTDIARLKVLLQPGQEQTQISILLKDLENCNSDTRMCARKVKRRLPQGDGAAMPLSFGKEIRSLLEDCGKNITCVAKTLQHTALGAMQQAALLTGGRMDLENCKDAEGLMPKKMEEIAYEASDKVYGKEDTGPYDCTKVSFGQVVGTMSKIANAMENGEYDFDGTREKRPPEPVVTRANTVKSQIADIETMKFKLESKEEDIKELKKLIKMKQEEFSEQQVRMNLVEKKLDNATKDGDERVEKMQRKLDEIQLQMKKKEKEFEETMDTLQSDIDTLEQEKLELKERLKILSKKTLLEGISRQAGQTVGSSPSLSSLTTVNDSPVLLQQISSLKEALNFTKQDNRRLQADRMKEKMAKLPPLQVPKKPVGLSSTDGSVKIGQLPDGTSDKLGIGNLAKETSKLLTEVNMLSACPRVVDITKRKPGVQPVSDSSNPARELVAKTAKLTLLEKKTQELQVQVTTLLAANRTGGQVRTDFSTFPTPQFARMLHEKSAESVCMGRISVPTKPGTGDLIPVNVQPDNLRQIHGKFMS